MAAPAGPVLAAAPVLGFLGAVLVAPVLALLALALTQGTSWSLDAWLAPWTDAYLRQRLVWTLAQALVTAGAAVLLGLPLAWTLQRLEFPGRRAMASLVMLPFVVPTLVAALGVLALLGTRGWLARWTGLSFESGAVLLLYGNLFFNLCVVVRPTMGALQAVNATLWAAARTLGASPWRVFWRLEWPLVRSAVWAAACLVFLYCFSGLGLALVLGGQRYATLEVEIYTLVAHELALGPASVLALWVAAGGVLVTAAYARLAARAAVPLRVQPLARAPVRGGKAALLVLCSYAVFVFFVLLPLASIALAAMNSVADWVGLWADEEFWLALGNTLRFTAATVVLSSVLGLLHGLAAHRWRWMRAFLFAPLVVSSVMVGFGLLVLYPRWSASLWVLLAGYTLVAYPFVTQSVVNALDAMPPQWLAAARLLGATPWRAFVRVTLPVLLPALRRGAAFAAATALGEFAVTLFLSRPEWTTLTTLIYQRLGRPGAANLAQAQALAVGLLVLAWSIFRLLEGRPQPRNEHA
ncbi:iron ABC transporter permease [Curvibacter sp. APW13]|uniref:ABC transporter permease n=1 Tax=Curvibacter sp. APW13 TaxID=3077236 RepID=UPI0028DFD139|nr:iron ABC transporter permease [Curvibacter sp. APW13]MDT8992072.1 iron ABC transporter permease [Curvibacter sp. APW13]